MRRLKSSGARHLVVVPARGLRELDPRAAGHRHVIALGEGERLLPVEGRVEVGQGDLGEEVNVSGTLAAFIGQAAGTTIPLIIDVNGYSRSI